MNNSSKSRIKTFPRIHISRIRVMNFQNCFVKSKTQSLYKNSILKKEDVSNASMNINVGLIQKIFKDGNSDPFRIFLLIKMIGKGNGAYFSRTKEFRKKLSYLSGLSERTIRKKIDQCIKLKWINKHENTYYVRSFDFLVNHLYNIDTSLVHNAYIPYITSDKMKFKGILFGIFTGSLIGKRRHGLVQNAMNIPKASHKSEFDPETGEKYSPKSLSLSFIASMLEQSKSTIFRWKRISIKYGILDRTKNRFLFKETSNVEAIKNAFPSEAYRTTYSKKFDCVKIQLTDQITTPIHYRCKSYSNNNSSNNK